MVIKQQYYTSCRTQNTSGFQIKAESPGIEGNVRQILNQLTGYVIPQRADSRDISTHPVALRYFTQNGQAFLVSSQSNGEDEYQRPGNFFAHSVVGDIKEISEFTAPIFYWRSPFWISHDNSNQFELPILSEFEPEILFDYDSIWNFINQGKRLEWLEKLLCAVIDYPQSQRKIIILDDNESVAFWIACISTAFTARYAQKLSFATYHHDPYTAPFTIVGTTEDSSFNFSSEEYNSYFIFNIKNEKISSVRPSNFAKYIVKNFNVDNYENEILDFFYWLDRYDVESNSITRYLDDYVNFRQLTIHKTLSPQSSQAINSAKLIIEQISSKTSIDEDDKADIEIASQILSKSILLNQENDDLLESYINSLQTLKNLVSDFQKTLDTPITMYVNLVSKKRENEAIKLLTRLKNIYSNSLVVRKLNEPNLLKEIASQLSIDFAEISLFWSYIGNYVNFSADIEYILKDILCKTFTSIPEQQMSNLMTPPSSLLSMLNYIYKSPAFTPDLILNTAKDYKEKNLQSPLFEWVYYELAKKVPIQERPQNYWQYWKTFKDLSIYELHQDLNHAQTTTEIVNILDSWSENFRGGDIVNVQDIYRITIEFIWSKNNFDCKEISIEILSQNHIESRLYRDTYIKLIEEILAQIEITKPDSKTASVYNKILNYSVSSIEKKCQTIIQGSLDLFNHQLSPSSLEDYRQRFDSMEDSELYKREANQLLGTFFANHLHRQIDKLVLVQEHFNIVQVTYVQKHSQLFWDIYWQNFSNCLLYQKRIEDIFSILDFWFGQFWINAPSKPQDKIPYFIPQFFMQLPEIFRKICKAKEYKSIKRKFETTLKRAEWFPQIEPLLNNSNQGILGSVQNKIGKLF